MDALETLALFYTDNGDLEAIVSCIMENSDTAAIRDAATRFFRIEVVSRRRAEALRTEQRAESHARYVAHKEQKEFFKQQREKRPKDADGNPMEPLAYINHMLNEFQLRLEITQELLETSFATGDGRVVTWGTATIADHRQRCEMLSKQALGTIETATRHNEAVKILQESQIECLNELSQIAVAA